MENKDKTYLDGKIEAFERCIEIINKLSPTKESNFELWYIRELIRVKLNAYKAIKEKSTNYDDETPFNEA